jgi:UDP-2-acetamido-3-amino-2,3-dideoxy-glucuronate N-acetyltransferase
MKKDILKVFADERGSLLPVEFDSLPFEPKRMFIVKDVPYGEIRGNHAHYKTQQLLICTRGIVDVIMHDGKEEEVYKLNENESILIPEMVWDSQRFLENDSQILVICSTKYDINDYIIDFNEFLKIKNK